jgi:prolipoprotein diacylglyceryltransferase
MVIEPHPLIALGALGHVYTHGLFFAIGALAATAFLASQRQEFGRGLSWAIERATWIFIAGLFGARIGFLLAYPSSWTSSAQLFAYWQGGLVSFTGILAGAGVAVLIGRGVEKKPAWYVTCIFATLLGWSIGRWGNFFAGDSIGISSPFWSLTYGHVPIQLFESVLCLGLFVGLRKLYCVEPVLAAWIAAIGYFSGRLLIDTWRDEGSFGPLHTSQWISFVALLICLYGYRKRKSA